MSPAAFAALVSFALAHGDGTFDGPLILPGGTGPAPVSIAAGRFNADDRLDLASANGSSAVTVLIQDPASAGGWTSRPIAVGTVSFSVASADFDGDGSDDLVVADPGTVAYFLRSR